MYLVHQRLRALGETPRYVAAEGEESHLPPQLKSGHKRVRRIIGHRIVEEDKE